MCAPLSLKPLLDRGCPSGTNLICFWYSRLTRSCDFGLRTSLFAMPLETRSSIGRSISSDFSYDDPD